MTDRPATQHDAVQLTYINSDNNDKLEGHSVERITSDKLGNALS